VKILKDMLHCAANNILFRHFHIKQAPNLDLHIFHAIVFAISDEKGLLNGGVFIDIEQKVVLWSLCRASFPEFRFSGVLGFRIPGVVGLTYHCPNWSGH
jgi:hypothetical protein